MAIDLVTEFLPYTDEMFTAESKKSALTNNDFDWSGAHTVKVYKVSTVAMEDYDRAGTGKNVSRYGALQNLNATTEEFTLRKDRSFTFAIDKLDIDETGNQVGAAAALARQLREVVIPEIDEYVYKAMCDNAGTKPAAVALTAENIYDEIIKAGAVLDNAYVPDSERCLVVTPETLLLMKKNPLIESNSDIGQDMRLKGVISTLDGLSVLKVPSSRVPAGFGFMLCHPVATVAPTKLEEYKIHDNPPGINGSLVEGRICYDAFVLDNKTKAIYYQAVTSA